MSRPARFASCAFLSKQAPAEAEEVAPLADGLPQPGRGKPSGDVQGSAYVKSEAGHVLALFRDTAHELKSFGFLESGSGFEGERLKNSKPVTNTMRRDLEG